MNGVGATELQNSSATKHGLNSLVKCFAVGLEMPIDLIL